MNSDDLKYIFAHLPYEEKNYYKTKIQYSAQKMYMTYLLRNKIKHKVTVSSDNPRIKIIDLIRNDESVIATIKNPVYSTNDKAKLRIIRNKVNAEMHLNKFNINTPNSKIYNSDEMLIAKNETFKHSDRAVVIKPLNLSLGRGVVTNVNRERFEYSWDLSRKLINYDDKNIIVQNFLEGFEVRATIMEGNLVSLTARIPPFIVGDGIRNISDLIDLKNQDRLKCNYLKTMLIKKTESINEFLHTQSKSFEYTPEKGEYILLNSVSNTSYGGETVNITELVSEEIKNIGLDAIASIPGLFTAGVDIMIKSFADKDPYVIEINTFPFIMLPMYPTYGKQVNPAQHYIHSVISKDKLLNHEYEELYEIVNENEYFVNYLNFLDRRINLYQKFIE